MAVSRWQGRLLPNTVSLSRPGAMAPALSHPMSPSLGHPCSPPAVLTPLRPLRKVLWGVMGWAGHVGGTLLLAVHPRCAQHADPTACLQPLPGSSSGTVPCVAQLSTSLPAPEPDPEPVQAPSTGWGGHSAGGMPVLTPAKPRPCRVAAGADGRDGAAIAEQRGTRAGAVREQRIKKRRNGIWASSRAASLPLPSAPFNGMKWCFAAAPLPHAEHRCCSGRLHGSPRSLSPWWPAQDRCHQPRLLPSSAAPDGVLGDPAPGKGGAPPERQPRNNS